MKGVSGVVVLGLACCLVWPRVASAQEKVAAVEKAPDAMTRKTPLPTANSTPEEVVKWLESDEDDDSSPKRPAEALAAGLKVLDTALDKEPKNARWMFGKAVILHHQQKHVAARDLMAQVIKIEKNNATYWMWYGNLIFASIGEASTIDKMGLAGDGKDALKKAVELDGNLIWARFGLAQFYIGAPGIAGGSYRKAREQGNALLAMPEHKGEFLGHMILAGVAADDDEWKVMAAEFDLAEKCAREGRGEGADVPSPIQNHAVILLRKKKDGKAALPVIERLAKARAEQPSMKGKADGLELALKGEALQLMKDWTGAIESYRAALALNPGFRCWFGLAECLEETKEYAAAAEAYETFSAKHPKDERAEKAVEKGKRMRKKGK
jgi:tetratricopeptide (TPR) repeat protein